jgi:hypothetical protein
VPELRPDVEEAGEGPRMYLREVTFAQPAPIGPRCPFKEPTMLSTSKTIGWAGGRDVQKSSSRKVCCGMGVAG